MRKIYLFSLHTTIVPNEQIPLHIFEDRYKRMIRECLKNKSEFGIVNSPLTCSTFSLGDQSHLHYNRLPVKTHRTTDIVEYKNTV